MSYGNIILRSLFVFVLFASTTAFAASVSISPLGDSSYTLLGTGMDDVAGIQLDIGYDAASLNTPAVTQGGLVAGAMLAANTTRAGSIKIAIVSSRAFSGSGQVAAISFASKSGSGGITSANVSMIDSTGKAIPATISFTNASGDTSNISALPLSQQGSPSTTASTSTASTTSTTSTASATSSTTSSATNPTYAGTVTLPTDMQQSPDPQPTPASPVPYYTGEPSAPRVVETAPPSGKQATDTKADETPQYVVYKGISERFKQYNGSKKLADVAALFDKKVAQTTHQEPALLLSDGQSKAILTVALPARIKSSPNFAVNGGKLVSFKQNPQNKGSWLAEVLPEAGAVKVTMTIIAGAEEFEYPLTVVPPVKTSLTFDLTGWNRFLKEVGTSAAPLHDLNNDGVRDYMDEYIFVANYLLNKAAPAKADAVKTPKKK